MAKPKAVKIAPPSDPMFVRIDRDKPMSKANSRLVSARAGMLIEKHTKQELLVMLQRKDKEWSGAYTRQEIENIAGFIDN